MGLDAFKKRSMLRVEALNHGLRNIPEDMPYRLVTGDLARSPLTDIEMKISSISLLRIESWRLFASRLQRAA